MRRSAVLLTDCDRQMLAFAAEHRFVVAAQPAALLDLSPAAAEMRLRALAASSYLLRESKLARQPVSYRITRDGLGAIASDLPAPRPLNLNGYAHDLGLAWLMVAARRGRFGPVRAVISERRMRSDDGRLDGGRDPGAWRHQRHGVRLGGTGPGGRERVHYPDMVVVTAAGHRLAFELELTGKPRVSRERILAGYAADPRTDLIVYLVGERRIGQGIEASAARVGIPQLVRVQRVVGGGSPADRRGTTARGTPAHAAGGGRSPAAGRGAPDSEAGR